MDVNSYVGKYFITERGEFYFITCITGAYFEIRGKEGLSSIQIHQFLLMSERDIWKIMEDVENCVLSITKGKLEIIKSDISNITNKKVGYNNMQHIGILTRQKDIIDIVNKCYDDVIGIFFSVNGMKYAIFEDNSAGLIVNI